MDEDQDEYASTSAALSFPVLQGQDLQRVAQLFDPVTSSNPGLAKDLQQQLQNIQASTEAWGLIAGLATHEDPNVRFFGAHTAQVKISRDWDSLPTEMHPALLRLLLDNLGHAVSPANPFSYQPSNSLVIRKLFGSLASLLLRLPFHLFPSPLLTVLSTLASAAQSTPLPPSAPGSGFNTPTLNASADDSSRVGWKMRLWSLEWLSLVVEEIGRAGITDLKRIALRKHLDVELKDVMGVIKRSMDVRSVMATSVGGREEVVKEAEAACRCAESWIDYGLGADELAELLPNLYALLPLPAASSAIIEALLESLFKYGKGTKLLTEPLIAWSISPEAQAVIGNAEGDPSEEAIGFAKLIAALVEHSSEWIVSRIKQRDVQAFLNLALRITGWSGSGNVDENISELTLPLYGTIQEAVMDSSIYSSPHEESEEWAIIKSLFGQLVTVVRRKVRWSGDGESSEGLGGLDREDRESFDSYRRDAGEVIVGAYYICRDAMLNSLTESVLAIVQSGHWQDIEAILHCIRFWGEGVPLAESQSLPLIFGDQVLGALSQRSNQGKGENRLRLTVVCVIEEYVEWFKFHPEHLLPVLSYLVASLTSTPTVSRSAADALKAICDISRKKLVQHVGAFAELHDKIGDLGVGFHWAQMTLGLMSAAGTADQSHRGDHERHSGPTADRCHRSSRGEPSLASIKAATDKRGILNPIADRIVQAVAAVQSDPAAQPILVQAISALTASFKGLTPAEDEIFDLTEDEPSMDEKSSAIAAVRLDPRMANLRARIENSIKQVVEAWNGDGEIADAISQLIRHSTLSSSETLISISPLPLLSLVTTAAERSSAALWLSLAATLVLRVNSPPSWLTQKRDKTAEEEVAHRAEETERFNAIGDAGARLVIVAGRSIAGPESMRDHPDVVEGWFKFCSAIATRFPGVLLRLPTQLVEGYFTLGILGLGAHERFSLKSTCDFFVSLLANTRFPSPLEPQADTLLKHFGPQLLRAIVLSAGSEGPRSVIPNLAELLAGFVTRVPGPEMAEWMNGVLREDGFPDARSTVESKVRLKEVVLKSRTSKRMREALHDFALVSRGLANTVYGNATAVDRGG